MKVICAWCGKFIRYKKGPNDRASHTMCDDCLGKIQEEIDELFEEKKGESHNEET